MRGFLLKLGKHNHPSPYPLPTPLSLLGARVKRYGRRDKQRKNHWKRPRGFARSNFREDAKTDLTLRPSALDDFIGQDTLKRPALYVLSAAKKRNEPIEHTLLYGPPGLGKTTLSHIIAREMGKNIRVTSGPAIERVGDLAAILSNLEPGRNIVHRRNSSPP